MIKTLLFLTALALSHGAQKQLTEPHPDCPEDGHRLLPHEYDCTKFYYCQGGEKFIISTNCPPNTEFSVDQQVCIHSTLANCTLPGYSTTAPEITSTAAPTTAASSTSTASAPSVSSATPAPTSAPTNEVAADSCEFLDNGCPADFNIHLLLPHETSCRKFYYCVHGELVLSKCGPATVFNPDLQVCDHPGSIDRSCEDEDSSSEEEANKEDSKSAEEIELLPNGCPADWSIPQYLPHEYYCNKYYQCNYGELVERPCAPGTHFNPALQVCDHIAVVGCILPGGDASSEEQEDAPTDAVTAPRPPSDLLENGCPADGSVNWLVPHEDDCNKFYYCVWGNLVETSCPAGLHFSFALQRCESPAVAGCICQDKDNCPGKPDEGNDSTGDDNVSEGVDDDNDNNVVASTEDNSNDDNDGAESGGNDNDDSQSVGEGNDNDSLESGDNDNDNSQSVGDGNDNDSLESGGNDNEDSESSGDGNDNDPSEDPEEDSNNQCEEHVNAENKKCEEECNVLPWAHDDCDKYWTCDGKKALLVVCSEGLQFNPATHTCDFACNAGCVRKNTQSTADHDGLRIFVPWNNIDENTRSLLKLIAN